MFRPGNRIEASLQLSSGRQAGSPGTVLKTYVDGRVSIRWDDGKRQTLQPRKIRRADSWKDAHELIRQAEARDQVSKGQLLALAQVELDLNPHGRHSPLELSYAGSHTSSVDSSGKSGRGSRKKWKQGQRVVTKGKNGWMSAEIEKQNKDGTYKVRFDHGTLGKRWAGKKLYTFMEGWAIRADWVEGSPVEVYSKSRDQWHRGTITGIGDDESGEFMEIEYRHNDKSYVKTAERMEADMVRPVGVDLDLDDAPNPMHLKRRHTEEVGQRKPTPQFLEDLSRIQLQTHHQPQTTYTPTAPASAWSAQSPLSSDPAAMPYDDPTPHSLSTVQSPTRDVRHADQSSTRGSLVVSTSSGAAIQRVEPSPTSPELKRALDAHELGDLLQPLRDAGFTALEDFTVLGKEDITELAKNELQLNFRQTVVFRKMLEDLRESQGRQEDDISMHMPTLSKAKTDQLRSELDRRTSRKKRVTFVETVKSSSMPTTQEDDSDTDERSDPEDGNAYSDGEGESPY